MMRKRRRPPVPLMDLVFFRWDMVAATQAAGTHIFGSNKDVKRRV
jgi:hypothetical protein